MTTRSRPSDSLKTADVYAPWCHLVFRHASVTTAVVIGWYLKTGDSRFSRRIGCNVSRPGRNTVASDAWPSFKARRWWIGAKSLVCTPGLTVTSLVRSWWNGWTIFWKIKLTINNLEAVLVGPTSTTDALVEMIHHCCEATDRYGTYVRIVLLDFAKAFDLINHEKVLVKLQANDVPPHILRWMASFLLNRTQHVKIGKNVSSVGYPKGGVPQGTVSGPRNFIMFINDLTTTAPIYKYVDDSTIVEVCQEGDTSQIQESVDMVDIWTSQNDMRLNSEKCKEMIIDFSRNYSLTSGIQSVTIGEQVLERVEHANMLGVTISNNLTWSKHVDNIVSKAGKRVYMLYQLKRAGISQNDLVKIYVSSIRPVLEYACPVWSTSLPKYLSDAIEMIQKRVLRSIHPGLHYDDILVLVGLQSLKMRRDNICKAYFNRLKCNTHRLNHLITERRDVHYSLRNANVYPIPVTRTDRYKNSIVPWGLCNWQ